MNLNARLRSRHIYTAAERAEIFEADRLPFTENWAKCRYGLHLVRRTDEWHVAHEIAWSRWGSNSLWNVGVSCIPCNLSHGSENMTIIQSISFRTWTRIAGIAAIVVMLFLILNVADAAALSLSAPQPPDPIAKSIESQPHKWAFRQDLQRGITRHAIQRRLKAAERRSCIFAQADFHNALLYYRQGRYKDAARAVRLGNVHLSRRGGC